MKKILSLGLAVTMAMAAMPAAYASNVYDSSDPHSGNPGTQVEYVATTQSAYTITVPAKMTPKLGQEVTGTVTLAGSWASNETVKVTADEKVVLTNSINPLDTHELAVNLPVMEYAGDNTEAKTYTGTVTLAEMPAAALFGEWTGKFNYNVELVGESENDYFFRFVPHWYMDDEYYDPEDDYSDDIIEFQAEDGMTWSEWLASEYNTYNLYFWDENGGALAGYEDGAEEGFFVQPEWDEERSWPTGAFYPDDVVQRKDYYYFLEA